jgi:hypothetical protein
MEFEVHKRHILRPTLSIDIVQWVLQWERQRGALVEKRQGPMAYKYDYNIFLMIFLGEEKM